MTRSIAVLPTVIIFLALIIVMFPIVFGYAIVTCPIAPLRRGANRMVNNWYRMWSNLAEMI